MTTYRTGNPIGSKDPRDLYDNAENLDVLVNDRTKLSEPDRLGVPRKTWHGMELEFSDSQADKLARFNAFIAASGYDFIGEYGPGIEFTEYNQIVRADGEFWRLSPSVDLPYTTTGAGVPEGGSLVPLGDAVLRQELSQPNGVFLVGGVQYVTPAMFGGLGVDGGDDTEAVQAYLDWVASRANKDAPLGGTWYVDTLSLDSSHDGICVRNGTLIKIQEPALRNVPMLTVGNLTDADTTIECITVKDVSFYGRSQYTGNHLDDDPVNQDSGQFFTGLAVRANPSARIRKFVGSGLHFERCGNSGISITGADVAMLNSISGRHIGKHTLASSVTRFGPISTWPEDFNPRVIVNGLSAVECATIFDLSTVGEDKEDFGEKAPIALLSNLSAVDLDLRTKIHGFWEASITNFSSVKNDFLQWKTTPHSGLDVANSRIKHLSINNMYVKGHYSAVVLRNSLGGGATLNNITVEDCPTGVNTGVASPVVVSGLITKNVYGPILGEGMVSLSSFHFQKSRKSYWLDILQEVEGGGV